MAAPQIPQKDITWLKVLELHYEDPPRPSHVVCFGCGKTSPDLLKCAKCLVAQYCQKECQVADWKSIHKKACQSYARVGRHMNIESENDRNAAKQEIFGLVRVYASAYAVHKSDDLGKGFLFIQSDNTLAMMSLKHPKDSYGRLATLPRSLLIHYLTLGEFDQEVCRDDFEMAAIRTELQDAVEHYARDTHMVVLLRFRCGHVALGVTELAFEHAVCRHLGREYYAGNTSGALQLNIDDM